MTVITNRVAIPFLKTLKALSCSYNKVGFAVVGTLFYIIMMVHDIYTSVTVGGEGSSIACFFLTLINGLVLVAVLLSMFTKLIPTKLREIIFLTLLSVGVGASSGLVYYYQGKLLHMVNPTVSIISVIGVIVLAIGVYRERE